MAKPVLSIQYSKMFDIGGDKASPVLYILYSYNYRFPVLIPLISVLNSPVLPDITSTHPMIWLRSTAIS